MKEIKCPYCGSTEMHESDGVFKCDFCKGLSYLENGEPVKKNARKQTKRAARKYITLAMFAALAYASLFVLRIGGIGGFLTFDVKDAVITMAAMLFGPVAGITIAFAVSLIEMITVSGTGPWGLLMNFVSSAVFAAVGSSVYRYVPKLRKTLYGAIIGLSGSVIMMTAVMMLLNLVVTPVYYNIPVETVKGMMLPLLLPFNLIKSILNAALVMILYKPISIALKKTKAIESGADKYRFDKYSIILTAVCLLIIAVCVLFLVLALNGQFQLFKR